MCAHFYGSSSSVADTESVNSSTNVRRSNWFPNPNDPISKSAFIRSPLQRSGSDASSSGLSRRLFTNQRKRRGYRNYRSTAGQEYDQSGIGFNPFRHASENLKSSSFGAGSTVSFSRECDLGKGSSQGFIFKGRAPSPLNTNEVSRSYVADGISGMDINHGPSFCESFNETDNLKREKGLDDTSFTFKGEQEMHNLSENIRKFNIKSSDNVDLNTRPGFVKHGSSYSSFSTKPEEQLLNQLKKLELRDNRGSGSHNVRSDSSNYGHGDCSNTSSSHAEMEGILTADMNKMKIESRPSDFDEPISGAMKTDEGLQYKSGFHSGVPSPKPKDKTEHLDLGSPTNVGCSNVEGLFGPQLFHNNPEMGPRTSKSGENASFLMNQHMEFSAKGTGQGSNLKYRRDLRNNSKVFSGNKNRYKANEKFVESPTPMEISPIQEMTDDNQWLSRTPATLHDCDVVHSICVDADSQSSVSELEIAADLISATQSLRIGGRVDGTADELQKECSDRKYSDSHFQECPPEESLSGCETESFVSANDKLEVSEASFVSAETDISSDLKVPESDDNNECVQSSPNPNSKNTETSSFVFSANSCNKFQSSAHTHDHRKKNRSRGRVLPVSNTNLNDSIFPKFPLHGPSMYSSSNSLNKAQFTYRQKHNRPSSEGGFKEEVTEDSDVWRTCEEWRLRGNTAYSDGNLLEAEEFYTEGVNCVSPRETSGRCLKSMMLCYSNRAATRMTNGRIREALKDCMLAIKIDPTFRRVQVRAANCFLALGEIEQASEYFGKLLHSNISLDDKIAMEASDGLRKAEKVAECMNRSTELLNHKASNDAGLALRLIVEALAVCVHSERLLEMQANALFTLQKYGDVIRLCELTLDFAETNSLDLGIHEKSESAKIDENSKSSEISVLSSSRIWRFCLSFKSHFLMGRLEDALKLVEKYGLSMLEKIIEEPLHAHGLLCEGRSAESIIPLLATVRQLLNHKNSGNEAFRSGRHMEAVDHYTTALLCRVQSGPFAAVCFCNRAAACKALGQITDAISDCNMAVALNANYLKALYRRAELFERIRDYEQAYSDLARILSSLSEQSDEKNSNCRTFDNQNFCAGDSKQIRLHLSKMEDFRRKEIPLDMYQILGVEQTASIADVRKAYRKSALRHHPDKAAQFFAKNESTCGENWTEIANVVQKDADKLFKMIGEAYAILSDPIKRSQYNEGERNNSEEGVTEVNMSRTHARGAQFTAYGDRPQQWREAWRSHWTSSSSSTAAAAGSTRWPY